MRRFTGPLQYDTLTVRGTAPHNRIITTRPEVPDNHHHPTPTTQDDDERQSDPFKELYLSWNEKAIPNGVLKFMMSEGATIEYWKARLERGEGRKVTNPMAYIRKCMENDPPGEIEPPLPRYQQYKVGEWSDFIESCYGIAGWVMKTVVNRFALRCGLKDIERITRTGCMCNIEDSSPPV